MSRPLTHAVDWSLAKMLFVQGFTHQQIAEQVGVKQGTLAQRIWRENWSDSATKARQIGTTAVENRVNATSLTIQERAERWTDALAKNVEESVEHLSKVKRPKSLKKLKEYEDTLHVHTKRGRATFGLDKTEHSVTINCGLIGLPKGPVPDVIDVEPQEQLPESTGDSQSPPLT